MPLSPASADSLLLNITDSGRVNLGVKEDLAILSLENDTSATPYIGAGAGKITGTDRFHSDPFEQSSNSELQDQDYKVAFGVDYQFQKNMDLSLCYQWDTGSTLEDLEGGFGNLRPDQEDYLISVGLKVDF